MKITQDEKNEIIAMWLSGEYYNVEIASWLGVSVSSVRRIINNYIEEQKARKEKIYGCR